VIGPEDENRKRGLAIGDVEEKVKKAQGQRSSFMNVVVAV